MGIPQNNPKINIPALIAAASGGDGNAFEKLYTEFQPKISRFVAVRINHKQTAEDVVAQVFIKAWEALQNQVQIETFSAWMFTIARNSIIDHYRTKRELTDITELENFLEYEDNIVETLDLDIQSRQFLRVLDNLNNDQQQVIRLKFLEDLTNEEIAAIMDKTPGAIRVIQHRAITQLKKEIGEG